MDLNIIGPINKLGYGIHVTNMIKALNKSNINVNLSPIGKIHDDDSDEYIDASVANEVNPKSETIFMFHDTHMHIAKCDNLIAFSVFETTKLHQQSINNLQRYSKMIFTPTKRHKEILIENGIDKPIHVVHEGIDIDMFNTEPASKLIETGNYTYILLGKNEKRKNTSKVLSSFIQTMQYADVSLICHTYNYRAKQHDIHNWYDVDLITLGYKIIEETTTYIKFGNSFSSIYFTKPKLKTEQMKQLYISANIGISYSSAEGWGLPEMEMMACGKPVIISNVLGHEEYLKDMPVYRELIVEPIGSEKAYDGIYFDGSVGNWSKLSTERLNEKLQYAYDNKIGEEISQELSEYYTTNYNWLNAAQTIKEILF